MNALSRAGMLAVLAIALVTGCATEPETEATVAEFISLAGRGVDLDYEPLQGPQDATDRSDLVVVGRLTAVLDGITIEYSDPVLSERRANTYATFVVDVDRAIKGAANGKVYVVVLKDKPVSVARLAAAMPRARVAMVLEDITDWTPSKQATVKRPSSIPADAKLYYAFADGLWLQGSGDAEMAGLFATPTELKPGWNGARTIDQFTASFS